MLCLSMPIQVWGCLIVGHTTCTAMQTGVSGLIQQLQPELLVLVSP